MSHDEAMRFSFNRSASSRQMRFIFFGRAAERTTLQSRKPARQLLSTAGKALAPSSDQRRLAIRNPKDGMHSFPAN